MSKTYYLTTAIAYTSGKPHIGNTYEAILADSIVRFKRQQGYDVRFQTGTDEHGQKIELKSTGIPHLNDVLDTHKSCNPGRRKLFIISFLRDSG